MKLIIAGSRTMRLHPSLIAEILKMKKIEIEDIEEVVSGKAKGIDTEGEIFARRYNIPIKEFPADWDKYAKAAGPIRNKQMAEYATHLLLIWDGQSPGSKNMKKTMERLNKPVFEQIGLPRRMRGPEVVYNNMAPMFAAQQAQPRPPVVVDFNDDWDIMEDL